MNNRIRHLLPEDTSPYVPSSANAPIEPVQIWQFELHIDEEVILAFMNNLHRKFRDHIMESGQKPECLILNFLDWQKLCMNHSRHGEVCYVSEYEGMEVIVVGNDTQPMEMIGSRRFEMTRYMRNSKGGK